MRVSNNLSNSEIALAALCGLLLAPALWVLIVVIGVIAEAIG